MTLIKQSFILNSLHGGKRILCDVRYIENKELKPIVVFVHGFKGFKDWGHFNLLADKFAAEGFVYLKLNLSHNGTTPEQPLDFADLDAFGNNNYAIELDDIKVLLDFLESNDFPVATDEIDKNKIYLMGHSRGGGVAIIKASEDSRIKKLVTWASISKISTMASEDMLEEWKDKGVIYIYNGRTKQNMPLYYQLAEECLRDQERISIAHCAAKLKIPYLNIHGDHDETVPVSAAADLKKYYNPTEVCIIQGANHVFGASHPFEGDVLPAPAQEMFNQTLKFLKK